MIYRINPSKRIENCFIKISFLVVTKFIKLTLKDENITNKLKTKN